MKTKLTLAVLLLASLTVSPLPAGAQSYSFSVPQESVDVFWNADGTSAIEYTLVIQNDPGAPRIEYVDLGIPNQNYDLATVTAEVDGRSVRDIQRSDYIEIGVALGLGADSIPAGKRSTIHANIGRVQDVLYADDDDSSYASAVFSPYFFDSSLVHGTMDLTVTYHLPPGVQADQPRYHYPSTNWPGDSVPEMGLDDAERVYYRWQSPRADAATQYFFGASFPAGVVPESAINRQSWLEKFLNQLGMWLDEYLPCVCVSGVFAFIAGMIGLGVWSENQRKKQYLPPKISIEGHGIKRGLTAVEAALLMEQPLDKVMTMILFGALKKGAAKVVSREPLKLEVVSPAPEGLNTYEQDFLKAFQAAGQASQRKALQEVTVNLLKSLQEKMKGFSRKETVEYYKTIIEKAWQQVTADGTPEVKAQAVDENLEWTMADRDFNDRSRGIFSRGPVFVPVWWGNYDPGFGRAHAMPAHSFGPTRSGPVSLPSLPGGDFAASVVHGVQNFSAGVIGDLTGFTSKVTSQTNPPPKSTSSGGYHGSGGGGHSCACACACAGCACACAGGGR
jgi:hypothetical protein